MLLASDFSHAPLCHHVIVVVLVCPKKQVINVDAVPHIALVAD
jgi:hypothetical protein